MQFFSAFDIGNAKCYEIYALVQAGGLILTGWITFLDECLLIFWTSSIAAFIGLMCTSVNVYGKQKFSIRTHN